MTDIIKNDNNNFSGIISIIESAKQRAMKAVNAELINMYWEVGKYLSALVEDSSFGDKVIDEVAAYIAESNPTIKGFNRRGLYRMKQFYETYKDDEIVTPLVTQISWTNHLLIMSGSKSAEERRFYMQLCIKENYSKRELERQIDRSDVAFLPIVEKHFIKKEQQFKRKCTKNIFFDIPYRTWTHASAQHLQERTFTKQKEPIAR